MYEQARGLWLLHCRISAYASAAKISSSLCLFFQAVGYLTLALSPQESSSGVQLGNNFTPVTDLSWTGAKGRTDYRCCFGLPQLSLELFRMKAARENVLIWDPSTVSWASKEVFLVGGAATCCPMVLKTEGTHGRKSSVWGLWDFTNSWSSGTVFIWAFSSLSLTPFTPLWPMGTLDLHLFGDHVLPALSLSFARENFEDAIHDCCFSHICCLLPAPPALQCWSCCPSFCGGRGALLPCVPGQGLCPCHEKTKGENYCLTFFLWDLEQEFMDLGSLASAASTD